MQGSTEPGCSGRQAFTLVELLLVLAIMGIVAAVVVPMTYRSLHGNQRRMAVRSVAGAIKYARSMAVLHQSPMVLVFDGEEHLVVDAAGAWSPSDTAASGAEGDATGAQPPADADPMAGGFLPTFPESGGSGVSTEPLPVPPVKVRMERDIGPIRVVAWTIMDGEDSGESGEVARLWFETNGRCTPFEVVLEDRRGEQVRITVDHLGGTRTEVVP